MIILYSVVGDILVVQPPFLFPSLTINEEITAANTTFYTQTTDPTDTSVLVTRTVEDLAMTRQSGHGYQYWVGVGLVLYAGLASALANVVQVILIKEESSITTNHHVIIGGEL